MRQPVIVGSGSCIPEVVVRNDSFLGAQFFDNEGGKLYQSNRSIIDKFAAITGIEERRYASPETNASDLAYLAGKEAIASAGIDGDTLDYIIVAHNFGDVAYEANRTSQVPSLASRVKARLQVGNPDCIAYDLAFGCAGWIEGMIQAGYFIRSGDARSCLIIGAETLSRVIDPHDRDSMIFSDGAGAAVLQASDTPAKGILAHKTQTHALGYTSALSMESSCSPYAVNRKDLFLKMSGRKVYEFALTYVPGVIKAALEKAAVAIDDVSKVLIHQANQKMDVAILTRLFQLYGKTTVPCDIMPMTLGELGNSSVATVPTLLDLLMRRRLKGHTLEEGEIIVMAAVGAGMNINAVVYKV